MTCAWQLLFMVAVAAAAGTPQSQEAQCSNRVTPLSEEQMLLQRTSALAQSSMEESSGAQCKDWCKPNVDNGKFTWGQLCFRPLANKTCGGCAECADAEEPLCGVGTFIEFGAETTCEACPTGRFTAVPGVTKCKRCKGVVSGDGAKCTKEGGKFKKLASMKFGKGQKAEPKVGKGKKVEPKGAEPPPPESDTPPSGPLKDVIDEVSKLLPDWTKDKAKPKPKPECVDTDDVADSYGTTCEGYTENPDFCAYPGDDEDFTASEMCCACGKKQQEEWLEDREEDDFVIDESLG